MFQVAVCTALSVQVRGLWSLAFAIVSSAFYVRNRNSGLGSKGGAQKDHVTIRISHSGSRDQYSGDATKTWSVGSLCLVVLLGP